MIIHLERFSSIIAGYYDFWLMSYFSTLENKVGVICFSILKRQHLRKSLQVFMCFTRIPTPYPFLLTKRLITSTVRFIAFVISISRSNNFFGFERFTTNWKSSFFFSYFNRSLFLIVLGICPNLPSNFEAAIHIS